MEEHITRINDAIRDLAKLSGEPAAFDGTQTARDPVKERQIRSKISGLMTMLYATTLGMSDRGISAAVLESNLVIQENWTRIADAYWEAKGL